MAKFKHGLADARKANIANILKGINGGKEVAIIDSIDESVLSGVNRSIAGQSLKVGDVFSNAQFVAYEPERKSENREKTYALNMVCEVNGADMVVGGLFREWPTDTSGLSSLSSDDRTKLADFLRANEEWRKNSLLPGQSLEDYCNKLGDAKEVHVKAKITVVSNAMYKGTNIQIRQTYYAFDIK